MSPENLAPEDQPIGRMISSYRLEAAIGGGGMGKVYRAWDEKLGRTVAVKALREYLSQDEIARKRFVREARLSSRIVHPYVATVFDVVESDGDVYLVMEYVEGRSLQQILARRTLTVPEASRYGREIAEALKVIHETGLVHRDLKPSNVMITNENHVKVMDFGVARESAPKDPGDPDDPSLTRTGHIAGTPAYMSPEQLRGKKVDGRSDLFSLGIVLYEAVTGEHPFMRETYGETLSAIINEPPGGDTEPGSLNQSTVIRAAVMRLLEKKPENRFQSAEELIPLLDLPTVGVRPDDRPVVPVHRRPWFTPVAIVAALAVTVGILYSINKIRQTRGTLPVAARDLVAVLPIEDRTRAGDDVYSGEMLAALLAADLAESRIARSMAQDRVVEIVSGLPKGSARPAQIAAIRRFAGADWFVAGSVFSQGNAYEAAFDLYRAGSTTPHSSFRVGAARAAGLIDLASVQILQAIDPRADPDEDAGLDASELSSRNDEALVLDYAARRAIDEYRFAEAIGLLERALKIDPQFITAQVRLASALELAGYGQRARDAADRAVRMIDDPLGTTSMRLALQGRAMHAALQNDFDTAIELRRQLAERYPDEPGTLSSLADALVRGSRHDEALVFVERALAIEEDDPWLYNVQARVLYSLERYDASLEATGRAESLFAEMNSEGGVANSRENRGHARWGLQQFTEATLEYEAAAEGFERAGLEVSAARARNNYADMALAKGELATARTVYDATMPVFRRAGNFGQVSRALTGLGTRYLGTGEIREAEPVLREAIELADELDNPALLMVPLANLASLMVHTGRIGEGRNLVERAIEVARVLENSYVEASMLTLLTDIHYQRGRLVDAELALRDLIAALEAPGGNRNLLIHSVIRLAGVHEGLGNLGDALEAMDRAVDLSSENASVHTRAYALWSRADILGKVSDRKRAEADLEAADAAARETGEEIRDLEARMQIARAILALSNADWVTARRHADAALAIADEIGDQNFSPDALVVAAESALRQGDGAEAARLARRAMATEGVTAVFRTRARVMLARALTALGKHDEAAASARQAFDEADSMKATMSLAMSAGVLVSLPGSSKPHDAEAIRSSGRVALEHFLGSLPEGSLKAVLTRKDVGEAVDALSVDLAQFDS